MTENSWRGYLFSQRKLIGLAMAISAAIFILLKYCYPYPDFFVDSTGYIIWAKYNFPVAYRPTGYSSFLQLTHFFSGSATFTVGVQYFLFIFSSLFCFLSGDYLFGFREKLKIPIVLLLLCNPILIFQANLISSDSLFCSLSVFWFTTCLWIIKKPSPLALVLQVLFLFLCFKVRYTALFFPVVAISAFCASVAKWRYRLTGIALTLSVIVLGCTLQENAVEKETGVRVFSGFAGWQLANNALYCYKHINIGSSELPTTEAKTTDRFVKAYIDSVDRGSGIGNVYLWDSKSPLKVLLSAYCKRTHYDYLRAWFAVSIPFNEYGWYIIKNHPAAFTRYFILPNTGNYFYPDREVLANYDYSNGVLSAETKEWFGFDVGYLDCKFPLLQSRIISIYPALALLLNIFNITVILFFLFKAKPMWLSITRGSKGLFVTWCCFYFGYMAFSIFAATVYLRFLDLLFVLGYIIPLLLINDTGKESGSQPGDLPH